MDEEMMEIEERDIAWDEAKEAQLIPAQTEVLVKVIDAPWGESSNGEYFRLRLKAQGLDYDAPAFTRFVNIPDKELRPDFYPGDLNLLSAAANCFGVEKGPLRLGKTDNGKQLAVDFVGCEGTVIVGQKQRKDVPELENVVTRFVKPVAAEANDSFEM